MKCAKCGKTYRSTPHVCGKTARQARAWFKRCDDKVQAWIVKAVEPHIARLEASAEQAIARRVSVLTTRNEFQAVDDRLTRSVAVLQQQASTLREHVGALAVNVGDLMKGNAPRLPTTHEMFERIPTGDLLDELRRRVNE